MAHNLNDGRMMYIKSDGVPWHGLGTALEKPATAAEAIAAARMDYQIIRRPIEAVLGNGSNLLIKDKVAVLRADTMDVLGVVGDGYKIVQNTEAFGFFDTVVGEKMAIYHTAGVLGKGERVWILAKLPKDITASRDDRVEKYLILANSHDGTSSLKMYFSPVRVVCQNTLVMSLRDAGSGISIRHSGDIGSKVKEARRVLGLSVKFYTEFEMQVKSMVEHKMTVSGAEGYYDNLLYGESIDKRDSRILQNRRDHLLNLFETGKGNDLPGVRHSLWAALNATTEFVDHYRSVKGEDKDRSKRLASVWFGEGARLKNRAYSEALALIKA